MDDRPGRTRSGGRRRQADTHLVEADGGQQEHAIGDLDPEGRDAQLDQAIPKDAHDENGQDRPDDPTPTTAETGAAEDDGRDTASSRPMFASLNESVSSRALSTPWFTGRR